MLFFLNKIIQRLRGHFDLWAILGPWLYSVLMTAEE